MRLMERMVYAFKAEKENLLESSSGGAFFALAEAFFTQKDGIKYVFGSSYDDNCNIITESACTLEECKKFRGSKYAECDYFASFADIQRRFSRHSLPWRHRDEICNIRQCVGRPRSWSGPSHNLSNQESRHR